MKVILYFYNRFVGQGNLSLNIELIENSVSLLRAKSINCHYSIKLNKLKKNQQMNEHT